MSNMKWVICDHVTPPKRPIPKWARMASRDKDGVWIAAGLLGKEIAIYLLLGFDGSPACLYRKHLYVQASWAKREFPKLQAEIERIEKAVNDHLDGEGRES